MTTSDTTTTSLLPGPPAPGSAARPGAHPAAVVTSLRRTVRSELVKLRTLRSQLWLLGVATAFTTVLGPVQSLGQVLTGPGRSVTDSDGALAEALSGTTTSTLLLGVLGVLVVAGEYVPRAIRTTFMLVPRRRDVVVGKAVALGLATLVTGGVSVAVAVTASSVLFARAGVDAGWGQPDTLRVSLGMVWYLVGWGVLGQVAAWVTHSKLGGAALLLVVMLLGAPLLGLLPGPVGEVLPAVLPSSVGAAMVSTSHATALGSPAVGYALWTGYLVVLTALAARVVSRRDA